MAELNSSWPTSREVLVCRRCSLIAILALALSWASGCARNATGSQLVLPPHPTLSPTATATVTLTLAATSTSSPTLALTPAVTATPTPHPSGFEKASDGEYAFITETGNELRVGQIPGLRQTIIGEGTRARLILVAESGNPYGLKEGQLGGEFLPNVVVDSKKQGSTRVSGYRLVAEVVNLMMAEANTEEAKANGEWQIAFPLDPGPHNPEAPELVVEEVKEYPFVLVREGLLPEMVVVNPWGTLFAAYIHSGANLPTYGFSFKGLSEAGYTPATQDYIYGVDAHKESKFRKEMFDAMPHRLELGASLITDIRTPVIHRNSIFGRHWMVTGISKQGSWEGYGLHNYLQVDGKLVFLVARDEPVAWRQATPVP